MDFSQSTGSPLVYWSLYLLLVITLIFCGYGISYQKKKDYKTYAWIAIITFALIEGLRWLRGADYYNYYIMFDTGMRVDGERMEFLFQTFIDVFSLLNLHPTIAFIFFSGLLISSFVLICSRYKEAAIWCLPVVLVLLGSSAENIVRQYAAISLIIIAYYFYLKDDYVKMMVLLACAPMIHTSALFGDALFLFFSWKKIPLKMPIIFVGLYCYAYFIWNPDRLFSLATFLSSINADFGADNAYGNYLENAEIYFTIEGSLSGEGSFGFGLINRIVIFLSDLCVVYWGCKACQNDQKLHLAYYFAFIGIIVATISADINILRRFGYWTSWTIPFVIGLIFCKVDFKKKQIIKYLVMAILLMRYAFYGVIHNIGIAPYAGCGFIWDK